MVAVSPDSITVIHVDDEPDFAAVAAEFVERQDEGLHVETVTHPRDALDHIRTNGVHCVVSDYDMPDQSGLELLETVREEFPDLPFILYTGKGSEEVATEAIQMGVTDYIQKESGTSQYDVLANRIRNAVEQQRAQEYAENVEHRLQTIAENTNDIIWKFTGDWDELLFINAPYEEIWGRTIDELRQQPQSFLEGIHPEDRDLVTDAMGELSSGESVDIEFRVNADEDFGRWVWVQGHPVFDGAREVANVVGFARDITEQKDHERTLAKREATLRRLYEITADEARTGSEQIEALLSVTREAIGTDYATFSHIQSDEYQFEAVDVTADIDLEAGTSTARTDLPICERVFETGEPLALADVRAEAAELVDPAWGISCYIGAPVLIDGEPYGTFCFYDLEPRAESFTEWEQTVVEFLGNWVGLKLSQKQRSRASMR